MAQSAKIFSLKLRSVFVIFPTTTYSPPEYIWYFKVLLKLEFWTEFPTYSKFTLDRIGLFMRS